MGTTIEQLAKDFGQFQTDFSAFVTGVQSALAKITAGGVSTQQQALLDSVDQGIQAMDSTVKGIQITASGAQTMP